ncbi:MAG: hypothetical protein R3268_00050 [Acidiferrobacterales bacterium]|nr:hypothetical protein [Acidiferrobacterales bacterium]
MAERPIGDHDVYILGYRWRVLAKDQAELQEEYEILWPGVAANQSVSGLCISYNHEIWYDESLSVEMAVSTILHEVIHAIDDHLGLNLTEQQVQGLETGLFSLNRKREQY